MSQEHRRQGELLTKALLLIGLASFFFVVGRRRLLNDADTFWHTIVGRNILREGFTTTDVFSFTRSGETWIANQWLAECLLAAFDWIGGFNGILWMTAAVLVVAYFGVGLAYLRRGVHPMLMAAAVALVVSASAYTLHARPHIFSIVLLGLLYSLLRAIEQQRVRLGQLWLAVPIIVVWSNLHGGVLGGVCTLAIATGGWALLRWLRLPSPIHSRSDAAYAIGFTAISVAALAATPFGLQSLQTWLLIMRLPLQELVTEHAPLVVATPQGMLPILLVVIYSVIFAATPQAWLRPTFWLPLVWFALTCTRIRHAPLFAIVSGLAIADLLPQSKIATRLRRSGWLAATPEPTPSAAPWRPVLAATLLLTPLLGFAAWQRHGGASPMPRGAWAQPTPRVWPSEILPALREFEQHSPEGTPVFNEPILGGFVIYNFPKLRVFIDGRCELYGEGFLRECVAAWSNPSLVEQWRRQYGFRAALIEADSPLRSHFDNGAWRLVSESPTAAFYQLSDESLRSAEGSRPE